MQDIHYVSLNEMENIKCTFENDDSIYVAELDGKEIKVLSDYLAKMSILFQFPIPALGLDGYNDWMRDLDWLDKEEYIFIIYHFDDFLKEDLLAKESIIENFYDIIFPFWRYEITTTVVGGKVKPFSVYFVK